MLDDQPLRLVCMDTMEPCLLSECLYVVQMCGSSPQSLITMNKQFLHDVIFQKVYLFVHQTFVGVQGVCTLYISVIM